MKKKLSVLKRIRQNKKRRLLNRAKKNRIKILTKNLYNLINQKDKAKVKEVLNQLISAIDKAVKRNIWHKNKAARKKSQLYKKVNALLAE
jgi:small subunit ribosomal protein S20